MPWKQSAGAIADLPSLAITTFVCARKSTHAHPELYCLLIKFRQLITPALYIIYKRLLSHREIRANSFHVVRKGWRFVAYHLHSFLQSFLHLAQIANNCWWCGLGKQFRRDAVYAILNCDCEKREQYSVSLVVEHRTTQQVCCIEVNFSEMCYRKSQMPVLLMNFSKMDFQQMLCYVYDVAKSCHV